MSGQWFIAGVEGTLIMEIPGRGHPGVEIDAAINF